MYGVIWCKLYAFTNYYKYLHDIWDVLCKLNCVYSVQCSAGKYYRA